MMGIIFSLIISLLAAYVQLKKALVHNYLAFYCVYAQITTTVPQ